MKKSVKRILALAVCLVMVLVMVPAKAHAVELESNKMPLLDSISVDAWGEYHFTTFADLQNLAVQATYDPYNYYYVYYEGYYDLTISSNITIPDNMTVLVYENDMEIPYGVTMAIDGGYVYVEDEVVINGTLNIVNYGELGYTNVLYVYGALNLDACLSGRDCDALLYGEERITVGPNAYFYINEWNATADDINEMCAWGTDNGDKIYVELHVEEPVTIYNYLTIPQGTTIVANSTLTIHGDVQLNGWIKAYAPVNLNGKVTNNGYIDVYYNNGGCVNFAQPAAYTDRGFYEDGVIYVKSYDAIFPAAALGGMSVNDFDGVYYNYEYEDMIPYWSLMYYRGPHVHTPVLDAAVAPTCLTYGRTEGTHCATCGDELIKAEQLAPLGHMYSDFYDTTCDVCGAARVVNPTHLTSSMYRMYNPNTGEHFYTGSMVERRNIEAAGWKYEGVGFTICANEGAPVYRLYQPSTGEHLYTMDPAEKNYLAARGWNVEGIAFNSCPKMDVPQYRLYNPNATIGAYHFTASIEERDYLLSLGWQDQGIGFYTCLQ